MASADSACGNKVHLIAAYLRRVELLGCAIELEVAGYRAISRWLTLDDSAFDDGVTFRLPGDDLRARALMNWQDTLAADIVIAFTEAIGTKWTRGTRHADFGIALGMLKRCMIVGPRENLIYWLPDVDVFETWEQCLAALTERSGSENG